MKSGPQQLAAYHAAQLERKGKRMTDEERAIPIAQANQRLVNMGIGGDKQATGTADAPKPPKKRRSDAGIPRKHAEPPAPATGKLSKEDASRLVDLIDSVSNAQALEQEWAISSSKATKRRQELEAERDAFIAEHTA